jgi:tripartite ATP-independent transporter DctM subunit
MSIELLTFVLFFGMICLLMLGIPITLALGSYTVGLIYFTQGAAGLLTAGTTTYQQVTSQALITIPLFLLMGNFLVRSGISERLFAALNYWVSGVRGGLAIVALAVCVALAMTGGFGPGILTMGLVATPAMLRAGYHKSIALGSVMAGGVLGEIIPPSIIMIILGFLTRISIGKIFMAGFIPGFILAVCYIVYVLLVGWFKPEMLPKLDEKVTWAMRIRGLKEIVLPASLIGMVLGSIFTGMATPTEAAGVGGVGAQVNCALYRRLTWVVITSVCFETLKITGLALWILIPATLFGVFYSSAGAQSMITDMVQGWEVNRWWVLIGMQVILLILGAFMDDFAIATICAPIFFPIVKLLGFDPLWFAVIFVLNMQVAYLSPPFGWALILMKGVAPPSIKTSEIWRAVPPWLLMQLLVLILVMLFPQLATWLPSKGL